jgi:hypothetical protein
VHFVKNQGRGYDEKSQGEVRQGCINSGHELKHAHSFAFTSYLITHQYVPLCVLNAIKGPRGQAIQQHDDHLIGLLLPSIPALSPCIMTKHRPMVLKKV